MSYALASVIFPAVAKFTANQDGTEISLVGETVEALGVDASFAVSSTTLRAALNAYFTAETVVDTSGNGSNTLQVDVVPGVGGANLTAISTSSETAIKDATQEGAPGVLTATYLQNEMKEDIQKVFNWDIIAEAVYGVNLTGVGDAIKSMLESAASEEGKPAIQSLFEQVAAQRNTTGDLSGSVANPNQVLEFQTNDEIAFVVDYSYDDADVLRSATLNFAANSDFGSMNAPAIEGVKLPLSKRRALYKIKLTA